MNVRPPSPPSPSTASAASRAAIRPTVVLAIAAAALAAALGLPQRGDALPDTRLAAPLPAPAFKGLTNWINSPPLQLDQLRGKVVLVDFWTYTCINCLNQLPQVKTWHRKYAQQGLVVVGVHSPEYDEERPLPNLQAAVKRLGIDHAVAQDNDFATWRAYDNRYWPALYLIDKQGRIVWRHFGEGAYDEADAKIRELLARP